LIASSLSAGVEGGGGAWDAACVAAVACAAFASAAALSLVASARASAALLDASVAARCAALAALAEFDGFVVVDDGFVVVDEDLFVLFLLFLGALCVVVGIGTGICPGIPCASICGIVDVVDDFVFLLEPLVLVVDDFVFFVFAILIKRRKYNALGKGLRIHLLQPHGLARLLLFF